MKNNNSALRLVGINRKKDIWIGQSIVNPSDSKYSDTMHWHDFFELELIVDGSAYHRLNNRTYRIQRGSIYLLSPADLHTLMPDPENKSGTLGLINLRIDASILLESDLTGIVSPLTLELNEKELAFFETLFLTWQQELSAKGEYLPELQSHLVFTVLYTLLRITERRKNSDIAQPDRTEEPQDSHSYIAKAVSYINYHFRDCALSASTVADVVHISPNYFGCLFKKSMGKSCLAYIKEMRMHFATALLSHTELSVSEISGKSGYPNTPYFISCFRAAFGITPHKFRERCGTAKVGSTTKKASSCRRKHSVCENPPLSGDSP